jgi:dipeptidyl aminopeptidase/acylaminoacyl peptidase
VTADAPESAGGTPFHDLNDYIAIPRLTGLRLSPDGSWLAATVQSLSADKNKYVTSIWRIDTAGGPPARLTRSAEGEGSPCFSPDGALLFTSKRPDPERKDGKQDADESGPALWLLPPGGGEARSVAALPGGITGVETAASASAIVLTASALPGAAEQDEQRRKARKDAGVTAILHETLPVRYWDHDLGPDDLRLFAVTDSAANAPVDLTPEAGRALEGQEPALSPDGSVIATGWWHWRGSVQA